MNMINRIAKGLNRRVKVLTTKLFESRSFTTMHLLLCNQSEPKDTSVSPISVAITHYNRPHIAHLALRNIYNHPIVDEIIFLDDGSDPKMLKKLTAYLSRFRSKVTLYRRNQNEGVLLTKYQAVRLCKNDHVLLLDSDNTVLPSYLNTLVQMQKLRKDCIYAPDFGKPHYDFSEWKGECFDYRTITSFISAKPQIRAFINCGNYVVPRDEFVASTKWLMNDYGLLPRVDACDVAVANLAWCQNGGKIHVLSNAAYRHRVHDGSVFRERRNDITEFRETFIRQWETGDHFKIQKYYSIIKDKRVQSINCEVSKVEWK